MDPSKEVCQSLLTWLHIIVPERSGSLQEVTDGVAMLQALVEISPEYFSRLDAKIKRDVGDNWRLKISNLKKINECVIEYYQDFLNLQVLDTGKPDVNKLVEGGNFVEMGKLLRLILGNNFKKLK